MSDFSMQILQRCNALNMSISELCREAGVSRAWYEKAKHRVPKSVEAYLKIMKRLSELEKNVIKT